VQTAGIVPATVRSFEEIPTEQTSDESLISRYLDEGDERAFISLMSRHLPRIRRLLFGVLNANRDDMQDVEQEILASLCRNLVRFRSASSFETYLYRFARNKAIDHIRKQVRQRRLVEAIGARSKSPEEVHAEQVRSRDGRAEIAFVMSRLSEEERTIVTMKDIEGVPIGEIAEALGLPEGTVKSRLHRTRRKISALIGGESR